MLFDPTDATHGRYAAGLIDDPSGQGAHKLVLTSEQWAPNWTLPGDDRPRVLVLVGPMHVPGRGYDTDRGWRVFVTGGDDTAMRCDLEGPGQRDAAMALYDSIGDRTTRAQLTELGFQID